MLQNGRSLARAKVGPRSGAEAWVDDVEHERFYGVGREVDLGEGADLASGRAYGRAAAAGAARAAWPGGAPVTPGTGGRDTLPAGHPAPAEGGRALDGCRPRL